MHSWADGSQKDDPKQLQAIWTALCTDQPAPLVPLKHARGGRGAEGEEEDAKLLAVMETARVEKHVKSRLAVAADHFNRDYKKGFQFLQVISKSTKHPKENICCMRRKIYSGVSFTDTFVQQFLVAVIGSCTITYGAYVVD